MSEQPSNPMAGTTPPQAHVELLLQSRRFDEAAAACEASLATNPDDLAALNMLALAELSRRGYQRACEAMARAVAIEPANVGFRVNYARTLAATGQHAQADAQLEAAKALRPDWTEPWLVLSELATARDEFFLAAERAKAAAARFPADGDAVLAHAQALTAIGRPEEAWPMVQAARELKPQSMRHASEAAYLSNFVPGLSPQQSLEAHTLFAKRLNRFQPITPINARPRPLDGRPIRIGLASPDFRDHSVAYFVEPILEHLDPARFALFAYHSSPAEDHVTARLRSRTPHWRSIAGLPPREQARAVAQDGLDILIELAGHTEHHVLPAMRFRAAPVQATYLGYPHTTGLRAIDYRIVDSITDPPGESDTHCVERLIRLDPPFLCYRPNDPSPAVSPAPCVAAGHVTFGSFNIARKLNDRVIALWSRVLRETPGSRLFLKSRGLSEAAFADDLRARFAARGVGADRLTLTGYVREVDGHLGAYRHLDIALDPTPYNGTTTTCEALWMGVPVLTLTGDRHAARVGTSLLTSIGLPELAAPDDDAFVRLAAGLANDQPRLTHLRQTMRHRMTSGPLCSGPAFCRRFEAAIEQMVSAGPIAAS